eukprot:1902180-Amphidinium_carterae.1
MSLQDATTSYVDLIIAVLGPGPKIATLPLPRPSVSTCFGAYSKYCTAHAISVDLLTNLLGKPDLLAVDCTERCCCTLGNALQVAS